MSTATLNTAKVFLVTLIVLAVSACGPVVPSNFSLRVMAAESTKATSVNIVFSDSVGAEGQDPSNFFISNLSVIAASTNGNSVTLTTSEQSATSYTVTVSNIWSEGGKPLAADADSATFQGIEGKTDTFSALSATSTGETTVKVTFDAEVGASGNDLSNYSVDGVELSAAVVEGSSVTLTTSGQNDRMYSLTVKPISSATGAGLKETTLEFRGTPSTPTPGPDTVAPELTWLEPSDGGSSLEGADVALKVSATDNVAVAQVIFYVNGNQIARVDAAPYETVWSSAGMNPGTYALTATAKDSAGNEALQTISYKLVEDTPPIEDTTPPTLSWLEPTNGAVFEVGTVVKLKADAEDSEELRSVSFYVNDLLLEEDDDEAYETNWSTAGLSGGAYILKTVAVDEAGNDTEQRITVTLKVPVINTPYADATVNVNYGGRDFQNYFDNQIAARYQPTSVGGYGSSNTLLAASWKASTDGWYSYYGMTAAQYQQRFDTLKGQGYRPTYVDGYTVNGETRFAAIWEKRSGPAWIARHNMTSSQYQSYFNTYKAQGYRPVHVSGYEINGQAYYAAIWEKSSGTAWATRHGMTSAKYQSFATEYVKKGYRITQVSGYTVAGQTRFAAIMEKTSGPAWIARHGMTTERFKELHESYKRAGYRIVQVDGYMQGDSARFAAIWHK